MNRIAVALVAFALAVPIIAQTDPPAKQDPQPQPAAVSKQKDPTADPGVRKLSRRESLRTPGSAVASFCFGCGSCFAGGSVWAMMGKARANATTATAILFMSVLDADIPG